MVQAIQTQVGMSVLEVDWTLYLRIILLPENPLQVDNQEDHSTLENIKEIGINVVALSL